MQKASTDATIARDGRCWSRLKNCGGICEKCGHIGERNIRHSGQCVECGGQMRCANKKVLPNGRCRMHGGHFPAAGPGHPSYKHGRTSKHPLIHGLGEKLERAMSDEHLLSLRKDAAIMSVRLDELLENPAATDYESIRLAEQSYESAMTAIREGRTQEAGASLKDLGACLKRAKSHVAVWREIRNVIDVRRRVTSAERESAIKAGHMLTVAQALHAMNSLVAVVQENVKDPVALREVHRQFSLLVGGERVVEVVEAKV